MVTYGLCMPTGKYTPGGDDNSGLGMLTNEFGAGTTLFLDADKNWGLSVMAFHEIHPDKKDTDIQAGDVLTIEGGLGRSWYERPLSVRVAYYAQWKMTKDSIGSLDQIAPILPSELTLERSCVYGFGPEINFPILSRGSLVRLVTARYQWEFDNRSTLESETFNLFSIFHWVGG